MFVYSPDGASPLRCPMTSQGSAHGRFARAIQQGNLLLAELAAREMGGLSLEDALDLTLLIAAQKPARLEAAAIRLHGRLELEAAVLTLAESQLFLAALTDLRSQPPPDETIALLRRLLRRARPTAIRRIS
jgi:hypothetical protein